MGGIKMDDYETFEKSNELLDIGAEAYRSGDYQKAQEYYEKSAKLGNAQAACNLGYIYDFGRTGEQDHEKAFYYYSEAAMEDNANAYYKVGDAYLYGNFVAKNMRLAFLNYAKALELAENSDSDEDIKSDIYYRMAMCYFDGIGVEKDAMLALKYINNAHTYSYWDRMHDKFMWQSLAKKIENLRKKIIAELDEREF